MGVVSDVAGFFGGPDTSAADAASARDIEAARIANEHTDRRIDESRKWSTEQSRTSWLRNVEGMEMAGLNPAVMLSGGGSQGSLPSQSGQPGIKADPVGSAVAVDRVENERKRNRKELAALGADTAFKVVQSSLVKAQRRKAEQDTATGKQLENVAKEEVLNKITMRSQMFSQTDLYSAKALRELAALVSEQKTADFEKKSNFGWFDAIKKRLNPFSKSLGR